MIIDKIGGLGHIYEPKEPNRAPKTKETNPVFGQDIVKISEEAIKAQEAQQAFKAVKSSPDIRQDRVREVKEKLAKGEYDNISSEILEKVAEKIASSITGPRRS